MLCGAGGAGGAGSSRSAGGGGIGGGIGGQYDGDEARRLGEEATTGRFTAEMLTAMREKDELTLTGSERVDSLDGFFRGRR